MYMVRKQFYISEAQDQALKRRSLEDGISEAELVRRALDHALSETPRVAWCPGRSRAIEELKETWANSRSVLSEPFNREDLYQERLDRQLRNG